MRQGKTLLIFSVVVFIVCNTSGQTTDRYLEKEHWKKEALENILSFWTQHASDKSRGAFYPNLDGNWKPVNDTIKFPSMIARHLFSYSAAYLMSGDQKDLSIAREIKDYLLAHAWDIEHGGWFDALDAEGKPLHAGKSTFVQVYVITGLTMYYFITHDAVVKNYIDKSNNLLEENAWDQQSGGYYDALERNWTIKSETKSVSSQLAPCSGYLLYLYLATRDSKYLAQADRIVNTIIQRMIDLGSGWVLETFDKNWKYIPGRQDEEEINIGHNIEIAWTLLRLYLLNGNVDYLRAGKAMADRLHQYGISSRYGIWPAGIGRQNPSQHTNYTYWWIQAYGNMFNLYLARVYPEKDYAASFKKGAEFWDKYFLDKKNGDTYFSLMEDGHIRQSQKANQYKASYHSVEHCLLNYLYLGCWVNPGPVTLYFNLTSNVQGELLYPLPIEKLNYRITDVRINGKDFKSTTTNESFLGLPVLKDAKVALTIF
ncbi:AGE family epimerase/isomerase [Flavihumibacter profundi]|uniref:AGE family epimerase/isomerase n=1 Tax=Flavihumibacter profundi TaxID=2716883 RepID=UPI001CC5E09C|nr:AGE family epimerase/isomerase [Flavihumibacter profundi]MBZ5856824.1 AGE family epimerase/isomerase [Flavihumibacter profundi]